ncbi:MAG: bifunctional phosphoribosylaminoimidazolecarboxamide formyltransferase/IMP cyclohydrolase [Candidatus Eisenbacteria bacterium]
MTETRRIPIRRALFSTHDKTGVIDLARVLAEGGVELLATGATARALEGAGLAVQSLEDLTGFGELFDGRLKTLTPPVHGGLLMRRDHPQDREQAQAHGIRAIDLLCVNLYPFQDTVARAAGDRAACIEMIDVGGPAMLRAAAKNHRDVVVVSSPEQYGEVAAQLREKGCTVEETLASRLAAEAFALTAAYDAAIFRYLSGGLGAAAHWATGGRRWMALRYGENPTQAAACYLCGKSFWKDLEFHQGRELSYNNLADLWCGWRAIEEFDECAGVVIKHRMPSGLALGESPLEAFRRARDCDALSAFGGIVLVNREVNEELADEIGAMFLEVVAAPAWKPPALDRLRRKKNLRILTLPPAAEEPASPGPDFFALGDAVLVQDPLPRLSRPEQWRLATRVGAERDVLAELHFAWRVVRHVRSNAIVLTRGRQTVGVGGGQTSRIDACEVALMKAARAGHEVQGSVLASDAFFPFPDVVRRVAGAGVRAIVQPGGSRNDAESVAACEEFGLPMYFTGERVFAH